jgi:hypothetical protein
MEIGFEKRFLRDILGEVRILSMAYALAQAISWKRSTTRLKASASPSCAALTSESSGSRVCLTFSSPLFLFYIKVPTFEQKVTGKGGRPAYFNLGNWRL